MAAFHAGLLPRYKDPIAKPKPSHMSPSLDVPLPINEQFRSSGEKAAKRSLSAGHRHGTNSMQSSRNEGEMGMDAWAGADKGRESGLYIAVIVGARRWP